MLPRELNQVLAKETLIKADGHEYRDVKLITNEMLWYQQEEGAELIYNWNHLIL